MGKRSQFLDEMGVPKSDLRSKPKCAGCGIRVTSKNFGMSSSHTEDGGFTPTVYYCEDCLDKPEMFAKMFGIGGLSEKK